MPRDHRALQGSEVAADNLPGDGQLCHPILSSRAPWGTRLPPRVVEFLGIYHSHSFLTKSISLQKTLQGQGMSSHMKLLGWAQGIFSRARPEVCSEQHLKVPKDKSQMSRFSTRQDLLEVEKHYHVSVHHTPLLHLLILVSLSLPPMKVLNTFSSQYLKEVSETVVESSRPSIQPQA